MLLVKTANRWQLPYARKECDEKKGAESFTQNLHQDRSFPVLVEIFLNEGMADHRKSVLIGFVASLFLHVCLVVCVEKCSFAIPLRVEKCKYSLSACVEKCKIQQVLCVEKCKP